MATLDAVVVRGTLEARDALVVLWGLGETGFACLAAGALLGMEPVRPVFAGAASFLPTREPAEGPAAFDEASVLTDLRAVGLRAAWFAA